MKTQELVQTSPRGWKVGVISQGEPAHGNCKKCGGKIWWGTIQFKGQPKPSWIAYSEAGHGGDQSMVMEKHDCTKPLHAIN
jgi:hypothetical protein